MIYPFFHVNFVGDTVNVFCHEKICTNLYKIVLEEARKFLREIGTDEVMKSIESVIENKMRYLVMRGDLRYDFLNRTWILDI